MRSCTTRLHRYTLHTACTNSGLLVLILMYIVVGSLKHQEPVRA